MRNQQREIELEREKIQMNKIIELGKKEEIDEWVKGREKIQKYGEDLIDQMHYNQRQKEIVSVSLVIPINVWYVLSKNNHLLLTRWKKVSHKSLILI